MAANQIRPNRLEVNDRFPMLGFTIRTDGTPQRAEVVVATDLTLFQPEHKAQRTTSNFFSSRAAGSLFVPRGEAVYMLPPEVLVRFVDADRLYFALATAPEQSGERLHVDVLPSEGSPYVSLRGLTGRSLKRVRMLPSRQQKAAGYGTNGTASLEWAGDTAMPGQQPASAVTAAPTPTQSTPAPSVPLQSYDDGFGPMPAAEQPNSAATTQSFSHAQSPSSISQSRYGTAQRVTTRPNYATAQEIITPYYNPADPASAISCQADAFSLEYEEWFAGVSNTTMFPHSAVCKINTVDADSNGWSGTGFYIGPNRILTAAHVLHSMTSATIIPGKNGQKEPFGSCAVTPSSWRICNRYVAEGSNYDLAVIDEVPIAAPGNRWFEFFNATPSDRLPIVICGYSAASDAVPELTQAIDGDQQHLHGGYARQNSNLEVIEYPILTLHGASGSPVYHIDNSLRAFICAVHVSGEPANRKGLNRGCFITPAKIDWIEGRTAALSVVGASAKGYVGQTRTFGNECFSLHWDDTPYQPQSSSMSCWAASAAMVVGWRDHICVPDSEIAAHVPVLDAYRNGLPPSDRHILADAWNLTAEPPASYTIEGFRSMLTDYGPLYVGMTWNRQGGGHARVLVGMESGGAADGSDTTMFLYDPGPDTPGRIRMPFNEFVQLYEGRMTESGGVVDVQILHADSAQGRIPAAVAPFALSLVAAQVRAGSRRLPAQTAAQSLSATQKVTGRAQNAPGPTRLPPPPKFNANIASPVPQRRRVRGKTAEVSWELDQHEGMKAPAGTTAVGAIAPVAGRPVRLSEWPYIGDEPEKRTYAEVIIEWRYQGGMVGDVQIAVAAAAAPDEFELKVIADISDGPDSAAIAAIKVTVRHEFMLRMEPSQTYRAVTEVILYGDGRHERQGNWEA